MFPFSWPSLDVQFGYTDRSRDKWVSYFLWILSWNTWRDQAILINYEAVSTEYCKYDMWGTQVEYFLSLFLFSSPSCLAVYHFSHYFLKVKIFVKRLMNTKRVFFYLRLLYEIFFIPRTLQRSPIIHVHRPSFNPLKTESRPLYLKTQFVPRSKHFSSRL